MTRLSTVIAGLITVLAANAESFSYSFGSTALAGAFQKIAEDHPDLDLNFIYNELENYPASPTVCADNAYDALRQTIGLNPVTVTRVGNTYYIEALQHGKYIYTGRTVGKNNTPVVAATVMLLAPKDSTVITYGITDESGHFSIPCDRQGVVAKLSCVGYRTEYLFFESFTAGTVRMTELPIQLKTITVEGKNSSLSPDKSLYRPTQRQKNASQTAIDLLRYLAIPQLSINLADESVTTLAGGAVAIYVNGLPASSAELQGLRTSDVRTIEYLDFPTDPRFGGNEHVINFIMQKYEYGGYTKLSINENAMIGLSSRASLYSKFTYRSMIFDLYAGASNHDVHNAGQSLVSQYTLTGDDGATDIVIRREKSDDSHFKNNQYPVTFRAVYDSDKVQIGNTVGFNFDQSPLAQTLGHLSFPTGSADGYSFRNNQPYTTRHFVWSGTYYFILPGDFQLSLTPGANYGHTDYTYSYTASLPGTEAIDNTSRENYYRISGGASLYKRLADKHTATLNIYGGTDRNEVLYSGTSPYENSFSDSYTGFRAGYTQNGHLWRFDTNAALQWERNSINRRSVSELYPLINISGSYSPSDHHSLQAFFHYGANYPGESVKSPNVLQYNEYLFTTGNPDLSLSRQVTFNLQYNLIVSNRFSMSAYSQYFGEYGLYVPVFEPYRDGQAILKTYSSDQDYNRTRIGLSFNLKLFDGNLQLAAQPSLSVFRYKGYYNMSENPLALNASATCYLNRFYLQTSCQSADKTIQGNLGVWYKTRCFYQLQAGWSNSGWNIRLSAVNLFRNDWIAATQTLVAPIYSETLLRDGTYCHRRINLSATYTFGYGRKVQRSNEVGEQTPAPSAILK
ncbi:MAG: TonB-dependent receptor family protein [Paramuribaculum sp.]|nr:TonB-dependent receptor family protein [Paramuribaculum sp.]